MIVPTCPSPCSFEICRPKGAAPPPPWTPNSIPNLEYWLDGETGITLGTPPNITSWHPRIHTVDSSFTQATEVNQPDLSNIGNSTGIIGDNTDILSWGGAVDNFKFMHNGSEVSLIVLAQAPTSQVACYLLSSTTSTSFSGIGILFFLGSTGRIAFRALNGGGTAAYVEGNITGIPTYVANEPFVYSIRYPIDGRFYIRKNGIDIYNNTVGTPSAASPGKVLTVGHSVSASLNSSREAQVCIYSRAITDAEETTLSDWLKAKVPI